MSHVASCSSRTRIKNRRIKTKVSSEFSGKSSKTKYSLSKKESGLKTSDESEDNSSSFLQIPKNIFHGRTKKTNNIDKAKPMTDSASSTSQDLRWSKQDDCDDCIEVFTSSEYRPTPSLSNRNEGDLKNFQNRLKTPKIQNLEIPHIISPIKVAISPANYSLKSVASPGGNSNFRGRGHNFSNSSRLTTTTTLGTHIGGSLSNRRPSVEVDEITNNINPAKSPAITSLSSFKQRFANHIRNKASSLSEFVDLEWRGLSGFHQQNRASSSSHFFGIVDNTMNIPKTEPTGSAKSDNEKDNENDTKSYQTLSRRISSVITSPKKYFRRDSIATLANKMVSTVGQGTRNLTRQNSTIRQMKRDKLVRNFVVG